MTNASSTNLETLSIGYFHDKRVELTAHAINEAVSKFNVERNQAEKWIRSNIRNARYVGEIVSDDGNPSRLFAARRIVFAVDVKDDKVITLYPQNQAPSELYEDLLKVALKHAKRSTREIKKARKETAIRIAELNVEIAELRLRKAKTSSRSVAIACDANINARLTEIDELNNELREKESQHRRLMKGVAAYV